MANFIVIALTHSVVIYYLLFGKFLINDNRFIVSVYRNKSQYFIPLIE